MSDSDGPPSNSKALTLEDRMLRFLRALPGAELVDEQLIKPGEHRGFKRADVLLQRRRIVVEVKTLTKDEISKKVADRIAPHRDRDDFPLFYGEVQASKVLAHLSDGSKISRQILGAITRSTEEHVRSAEQQIHDTRRVLGLEGSAGLLVLLNESIDGLAPDVVADRVRSLMWGDRAGRAGAEHLTFAWLVFESHIVSIAPSLKAFPSVLIEGRHIGDFPWLTGCVVNLQEAWARANYGASIEMSAGDVLSREFESSEALKSSPVAKIRRQELWEREYDAAPFLRDRSDSEVLEFGAKAIARVTPYFLKGGTQASRQQLEALLRAVTCFFREANSRGLDLRMMPKPDATDAAVSRVRRDN